MVESTLSSDGEKGTRGESCSRGVRSFTPRFYSAARRYELTMNNFRRLPQGMLGAILMPIGLFLFAWTCSPPSIPYIIPILSCVPFGMGILLIFACIIAYLMDTYQTFTASALAATVVLRSILGAIFPLFVDGLIKDIGIRWGASVFAFMALACAPLPFVIYVSSLLLLSTASCLLWELVLRREF